MVKGRGKWEEKAFVPHGTRGSSVVGLGGRSTLRVQVGDSIGFKITEAPIDVLQVLRGDDGDLDFKGPRRH